ncbi:hypothetical protein M885DRAFT_570836 [Pelagophyceae sp. CCMP2097]|nr:hypothetical protein M885DRAFT_570836 [Pelagophyceae sp. CCMP2097]
MGKIVPKKWVGSSDNRKLVDAKRRTPKDYEHVKRARRKAKTAHRKHGAPLAKRKRTVRQWVNRTPVAPRVKPPHSHVDPSMKAALKKRTIACPQKKAACARSVYNADAAAAD